MSAPPSTAPRLTDHETSLRLQVLRLSRTMSELERGYRDLLDAQHGDLGDVLHRCRQALDGCMIMRHPDQPNLLSPTGR